MTAAQTSVGMDGAANSCTRLTATAANGTALQTLVAAASSRTYSCFIRRVTGTGTIAICQDGVTFTDVTAQVNAGTLGLVQLTASQLNAVFGIRLGTNGDAVDVDCNQFEAGTFATTPIPAAGTRAVDGLIDQQAGNVDVTQGAAYAELTTEWTTVPPGANFAALSIGAIAAGWVLFDTTATASTVIRNFDGTNQAIKVGLSDMATGVRKRAASWGAGGLNVTGDGLAVANSAFDGANGVVGFIYVGGTNTIIWNGGIKNLAIWPTQLPDATLVAITT
jgi:hypothetical protein